MKCNRCGLPHQPDDHPEGLSHVTCDEMEMSETWIDEQLAQGEKDRQEFNDFWAKVERNGKPERVSTTVEMLLDQISRSVSTMKEAKHG